MSAFRPTPSGGGGTVDLADYYNRADVDLQFAEAYAQLVASITLTAGYYDKAEVDTKVALVAEQLQGPAGPAGATGAIGPAGTSGISTGLPAREYFIGGGSQANTFAWTVPANVQKLFLRMWGGGAKGSAVTGGQSGGYIEHLLQVTPGDVFNVTLARGQGNTGVASQETTRFVGTANAGTGAAQAINLAVQATSTGTTTPHLQLAGAWGAKGTSGGSVGGGAGATAPGGGGRGGLGWNTVLPTTSTGQSLSGSAPGGGGGGTATTATGTPAPGYGAPGGLIIEY